uniref:DUF4219 domain-containing protein n=1 Tax=Trichuris muris TaxID=70415 RepID=A0A5S6Q1Q5_TRIMR
MRLPSTHQGMIDDVPGQRLLSYGPSHDYSARVGAGRSTEAVSRVISFCRERVATDGDQAKFLITKLNGSNYQIWKLKVKVLLMKYGLWDVVNHVKPEPTPQGWYQRECKAIAAICLTVEDDQLLHLTQLETAREMWQALQRLHERSSIGSRLSKA